MPHASNFLTEFSSSKAILQLIHLLEVAAAALGRFGENPPFFPARRGQPGIGATRN
jgi:hypothetical protein